MKTIQVTKEQFYSKLMAEKKDVITNWQGNLTSTGKYYPCTMLFEYRQGRNLFGKTIDLGYINGIPATEFYLQID